MNLINPRVATAGYILPVAPKGTRYKLDILENPSAAKLYPDNIIRDVDISSYPRTTHASYAPALINRLHRLLNTNPNDVTILLTCGSDNAIKLIFEVFSMPSAGIIIPIPTYPHALHFAHPVEHTVLLTPHVERGDDNDIRLIAENCKTVVNGPTSTSGGICYIVNPNLPMGYYFSAATIRFLANSFPTILFVIDEAYYDYGPREPLAPAQNIIILRTFSKLYGLAGLRIGFLAAPTRLGTILSANYNEKSVSEVAMAYALYGIEHVRAPMLALYEAEREFLLKWLPRLCQPDAPICAFNLRHGNFYLIYCSPAKISVPAVCSIFSDHGIQVRDKDDTIKSAIRICIQGHDANFAALRIIQLINLSTLIQTNPAGLDLDGTLREHCHDQLSQTARVLLQKIAEPTIITNDVTLESLQLLNSIVVTTPRIKCITPLAYFRNKIDDQNTRIIIPFCPNYVAIAAPYFGVSSNIINANFDVPRNCTKCYVVILDNFWYDFAQVCQLCAFIQEHGIKEIYVTDSSKICSLYHCGTEQPSTSAKLTTIIPDMTLQMGPIATACNATIRNIGKPNIEPTVQRSPNGLEPCPVFYFVGDSDCDKHQKISDEALAAHIMINPAIHGRKYNFEEDIFEIHSLDDLL